MKKIVKHLTIKYSTERFTVETDGHKNARKDDGQVEKRIK